MNAVLWISISGSVYFNGVFMQFLILLFYLFEISEEDLCEGKRKRKKSREIQRKDF